MRPVAGIERATNVGTSPATIEKENWMNSEKKQGVAALAATAATAIGIALFLRAYFGGFFGRYHRPSLGWLAMVGIQGSVGLYFGTYWLTRLVLCQRGPGNDKPGAPSGETEWSEKGNMEARDSDARI